MQHVALIIVVTLAVVLLAWWDARANPFKPCRRCGGDGKKWASGKREKYGRCPVCQDGAKKERRRLVARIFGTGR